MPADLLVIDLGNSRLKWGRVDPAGTVFQSFASSVNEPDVWSGAIDRLGIGPGTAACVATVNPPIADRLGPFLADRGIGPIRWFRSAADVPIRNRLDHPDRTGADRALAVLAAIHLGPNPGPGIVVQCGTAITVERIDREGNWLGGAIAIGPGLASRALRSGTAQLPQAEPIGRGTPPPPWGASTLPALEAGIVWGAVGAIRELVARQSEGLDSPPWVVWTGGDAEALCPLLEAGQGRVEPDLVLRGIALAVFRSTDPGGQAIDSAGPTR